MCVDPAPDPGVQGRSLDKWVGARMAPAVSKDDRASHAVPDLLHAAYVMSLSPREQNILEDIESRLRGEDPALARQLTRAPGRERARGGTRMLVLTAVSIVVGVGLMILAAVLDSPILMVAAVSFLVVVPTLTGLSYFVGRE